MEEPLKCNTVNVEPFIHQVGGHSSLLCFEEGTICKPLVPRELEFYETLPEALRKFTPNFYGVVQVRATQDDDEYVSLVASLPDCYQPQTQQNNGNTHRIRVRRTGSIEVEGDTLMFIEEQVADEGNDQESTVSAVNPWVQKCHRTTLQEIITQSTGPNYILLENLTRGFVRPCVLDLKMGTRHYDDVATLPKKQSKMFKVVSTTSGKLGARLGGMQVYQLPSRRYLCRNKFYGRGLSVAGFQLALRQFLHNGRRLRLDVLAQLILRLEQLADAVAQTDAVRFYTTSLLLLYEGDDRSVGSADGDSMEVDNGPPKVDNDSSQVNISLSKVDNGFTKADNGVTKVDNDATDTPSPLAERSASHLDVPDDVLKRYASAEALTCIAVDPAEEARLRALTTRRRRSSVDTDDEVNLNHLTSSVESTRVEPPRVDVRIIDFAHSTHKAIEHESVAYSGPDRGFLFGLENLIAVLKAIERDRG